MNQICRTLTILAVINALAMAAVEAENHALLIGVTRYKHAELNKPRLQFPEDDARAIGVFLVEHGYNVKYLLGEAATKQQIEAALEQLSAKGESDGAVLVGLWGHGVEFNGTNEAMFCPFDSTIQAARDRSGRKLFSDDGQQLSEPNPETLVSMKTVLDGLRIAGAGHRILIADCCRSSPNLARGRAFGTNVSVADLPDNTAALFACSDGEKAFEHPDWQHGAMTKSLLDLLPKLAEQEIQDISSITGKLRRNVQQLVSNATGDRETQTVQPITNGVPLLKLQRLASGKLLTNSLGMEFRRIPNQPWCMSSHEVTQGQYLAVMKRNPSAFSSEGLRRDRVVGMSTKNLPVEMVSFDDCCDFCRRLSKLNDEKAAGRTYRLPSESEWELACRAGSDTLFSFGNNADNLGRFAWYRGNTIERNESHPQPVGGLQPNSWALFDMHGNVAEWCTADAITGEGAARGGSWLFDETFLEVNSRDVPGNDSRQSDLGFRIVMNLPISEDASD